MKTRVLFWIVYFALWAIAAAGCKTAPGNSVAQAITPMGGAHATGAGGVEITPPPAAAEPSEQHAIEETFFASPPAAAAPAEPPAVPAVEFHPSPFDVPAAPALAPAPPVPPAPSPAPVYRRVETHTKLGAQQEVAPMLKEASGWLGGLTKAHWLGALGFLVSLAGVLHAAGNRETGYPAVWLKVMVGSVITMVMGDALWFWILVGVAGLFYLGQKLGVVRVPPLP